MKRATIALAALLATTAWASEPTTIGVHLGTRHSVAGLCDANPGLYVVLDDGATAGFYRNSECRLSVYAGRTWSTTGRVSFALTAGMVTGYRARPLTPLVVPSVALQLTPTATARLTYLPRAEKRGASGVHLSMEWKL